MEPALKQRLVGAAVLIALAVIFLPMLVQGPAPDSGVSDLSLDVPPTPTSGYETRDLPLVVPQAATSEGLLADDGSLATVDTASAPSPGDDAGRVALPPSADAADPAVSTASPLADDATTVAAAPLPETPATTTAVPEPARPEPAKPAPAPVARLPAATAGGDYAVGFGAYATRANAGTVVDRLRKENLPAYVEETTVGGRDAWRVRIGPYASRADAESARIAAGRIGSSATASVVALDATAPSTTPAAAPAKPAATSPGAATAAKPAPAASTPAAASGTGFAVQLGAFSSVADANALRDRARGAGIAAFTETVQTDRGPLTRVKAGPVVSRGEADQLKAQASSKLGVDGLVRSHP